MSDFANLMDKVKNATALHRKKAIQPPLSVFNDLWTTGATLDPIGDDAAILQIDGNYLLFSCDGILPQLVEEDPYWAGYCAVLVSVSDIYAMGGRPIAVVNLLSAPNEENALLIANGMAEGCRKLGVPMVGGHFHPGEAPNVATAIIGKASHLLRATEGIPGQALMAVIDIVGEPYKHYQQWNSTTHLPPQILQRKLDLLPQLAEAGLVSATRDISNAGILGTVAMLAENSNCGAAIQLDTIPIPEDLQMVDWLQFYPGYGFILSVDQKNVDAVKIMFEQENIATGVIGHLTHDAKITVSHGNETITFLDLNETTFVLGVK